MSAVLWVDVDATDTPCLWTGDRDLPRCLLVRTPANAELFDAVVALQSEVAQARVEVAWAEDRAATWAEQARKAEADRDRMHGQMLHANAQVAEIRPAKRWHCDVHGVWNSGDCQQCDAELIALTEADAS